MERERQTGWVYKEGGGEKNRLILGGGRGQRMGGIKWTNRKNTQLRREVGGGGGRKGRARKRG